MSQKPTISLENTTQFLQGIFTGVSQVNLLSGGEWSQAYSFVSNSEKYVLRWCNSAETFEKDAFASRFDCEAMPIPKIISCGTQYEKEYAVSKFAQGNFIEKLSANELEEVLPALLNLFDALQAADITQTSGYGNWGKNGIGESSSWKEYLLGVKKDQETAVTFGWRDNLANSPLGMEAFDQLHSKLELLVEHCPEERQLIHSDLLNYNLLTENAKISGVIDWQCSLYGDALYDIAWFIYYAPWYPHFQTVQLCEKIIAHFKSSAANTTHIEERLSCYYLHIGLGSIAYNAFKKDWQAAKDAAEYTLKIISKR